MQSEKSCSSINIEAAPADPILGLGEAFKAETRPEKVNLGIGVYKDASGATPIVKAVKEAEKRLLESETTKNYLTIDGVADYNEQTQILLFGADHEIVASRRAKTAQSLGGTGALRIAAEFAKRQLNAQTVWISNPTWPNHNAIFKAVGIQDKPYRYYNAAKHGLDWDGMIEDLGQAQKGDVVLLHGCCHNPTGIDPTPEQWETLAKLSAEKGWLPLFDFAYQGFGNGLEEDAYGLRTFLKYNKELLIASSYSKNFGMYNERVGAFTLVAEDEATAARAHSQVKTIIRTLYSNPASHGANTIALVLKDADLKAQWIAELDENARSHQSHAPKIRRAAQSQRRKSRLRLHHRTKRHVLLQRSHARTSRPPEKRVRHLRRSLRPHQRRRHYR